MATYVGYQLSDTKCGKVNIPKLYKEILEAPSIPVLCTRAEFWDPDQTIYIYFAYDYPSDGLAALTAVVNNHDGEPEPSPSFTFDDGKLKVTQSVRTGMKLVLIGPNFCDKTTWVYDTEAISSQNLVGSGDAWHIPASEGGGTTWSASQSVSIGGYFKPTTPNGYVYKCTTAGTTGGSEPDWDSDSVNDGTVVWARQEYHVICDVRNGKISDEDDDFFVNKGVTISDSGTLLKESTNENPGRDYSVNFTTGLITFATTRTAPIVSYHRVLSSKWIITPDEGEKLFVEGAEAQFDTSSLVRDTVIFEVFAQVGKDPILNYLKESPYNLPDGYEVSLGNKVYKTKRDFIREANYYYRIPKDSGVGWRDQTEDIDVFGWDADGAYSGTIELRHSWGRRLVISLKNDTEFPGIESTATLYGRKESEA